MATELELTLFSEELKQVQLLPEGNRWEIERDESVPLGVFVTLHPIGKPADVFKARLRWGDYFRPPSLKFVPVTGTADTDPMSWPKCFGFRPTSLDACLPWTEEGHNLHPEWRNSPAHSYPKVEVPLQYAVLRLQQAMDSSYMGRGP